MLNEIKDKAFILAIWVIAGFVISLAIIISLTEISWLLLDPMGQYYNSDTMPLFIQLEILIGSIINIWTFILTPVGMIIAYIGYKIYE